MTFSVDVVRLLGLYRVFVQFGAVRVRGQSVMTAVITV